MPDRPKAERARLIQMTPPVGWGPDLTGTPNRRCYEVEVRVLPNDHPQANDPKSLNYTGLSAKSDRSAIRIAHDQVAERDLVNSDTLIVLDRDREEAERKNERPRFARVQETIPAQFETMLWVKWLRADHTSALGEVPVPEPGPTEPSDDTPSQDPA